MDAGLCKAESGGHQDVEGLGKCLCHLNHPLLVKALMGPKGVEKWTPSSAEKWQVHVLEEWGGGGEDIPTVTSRKYSRLLSLDPTDAASIILKNPCLARLRSEDAQNPSGPRPHPHSI